MVSKLFIMSGLFRDTFFGQTLRVISRRRVLKYPEELDRQSANNKYGSQATEKSLHRPFIPSETSSTNTAVENGSSAQPKPDGEAGTDPNLVDWEGSDDPGNPQNWSTRKKIFVSFLICLLTFGVYIGSSIYSPGTQQVAMEFQISQVAATLGLTMFVLGYAIGPMFLAPLSEIPAIGRNPIYIITLAIFVAIQAITATVCNSLAALIILRFLAGFIGSPVLATGGASLADIWSPAKRTYAIGIWGIAAVCGPVLGPLLGGFAAQAEGWRWTIWVLLWLSGGVLVVLTFTLPETSATNILTRRARRLRRITGNQNLKSPGEIQQAQMTGHQIVMMAIVRPFQLAFTQPIVFALNLYIALIYGLLYIWFESFAIVFSEEVYTFNLGEEGLSFMGIFVGAIVTVIAFSIYVYYYLEKKFDPNTGQLTPIELRLQPAMVGAFFIPICLFWFGWTSRPEIPWIVPIIGKFCLDF